METSQFTLCTHNNYNAEPGGQSRQKGTKMKRFDFISIDGRRDCYGPGDIKDTTMTVGELIEYLSEFDEEMPIMISNDGGYTYGKIKDYSINEESYGDEEDEEEEE